MPGTELSGSHVGSFPVSPATSVVPLLPSLYNSTSSSMQAMPHANDLKTVLRKIVCQRPSEDQNPPEASPVLEPSSGAGSRRTIADNRSRPARLFDVPHTLNTLALVGGSLPSALPLLVAAQQFNRK